MKRFLLFWAFLCFGALSVLAQQKSLPVVQYPSEILQPPRIVVRMPSVTRLTLGRIYYGAGYGRNVIFWRPPVIYMQPLRILSLPMSASDSLSEAMKCLRKDGKLQLVTAENELLRGFEKSSMIPQKLLLPAPQIFGSWHKFGAPILLPRRL